MGADHSKNNSEFYYHGSPIADIETLLPMPSSLLNKENVVFATNDKWLAVLFAAKIDNDISCGFYKNKPYIWEQRKGAIENCLVDKSGYVYTVKKESFEPDERLGLKNHEFISKQEVEVLESVKIDNIFEVLQKMEVIMLPYMSGITDPKEAFKQYNIDMKKLNTDDLGKLKVNDPEKFKQLLRIHALL